LKKNRPHLLLAALAALALPASAGAPPRPKDPQKEVLVERVADTGFLQLKAESFAGLDARQKELAYWLSEAAIAIDPIIYDQRSRFGLRQKRLLEALAAHPKGIDQKVFAKLLRYTKLFWANRGNHNEYTSQKFLPEFTPAELAAAAQAALKKGAFKTAPADLAPLASQAELDHELGELAPAFFEAAFEPQVTAKNPEGDKDILQASANNFYAGVSLADLKDFKEKYALNSRLVKEDGRLVEVVYRAGTPDGATPPGLYAAYLRKADEFLAKAAAVADAPQAKAINALIRFYQTGAWQDWIAHDIDWVQNNALVDFSNGFVEVYLDARGAKGSSQGFVTVTDRKLNALMAKIAENAQYFEDKAPWDPQYRKQGVRPPLAKAVDALIETGDFTVGTVGDNLPNEDDIHEKYGSKSFLFTESSRELSHAAGFAPLEEFAASPEEVASGKKYNDEADDLETALHEIIGHGSGKVKVAGDPASYLKEYYSAMEEARADLMALWNVWDPKLKELGLVSDQEAVAREMYYQAARAPLTQLRRIPKGDTIEEDHQRDRALIVNYIMDKTGAIAYEKRGGKTYVVVKDFAKMREGVGLLLAEIMRIKAEGDYPALKALTDKYAVHFDAALRDEVAARYKKLDLPSCWAGIFPELKAVKNAAGNVVKVDISYPKDASRQYLRYGAMYDPGLAR
jgi:dipeptidyl-peptidase-3